MTKIAILGAGSWGTALAVAMLIVYKHDANLQRLVQGTEPKFSFRRKSAE